MSTGRTHNDARLPLRLSTELLDQVGAHAAARGETRSEFARRALEGQMARDRLTDRLARVRRACSDGPFFLDAAGRLQSGARATRDGLGTEGEWGAPHSADTPGRRDEDAAEGQY